MIKEQEEEELGISWIRQIPVIIRMLEQEVKDLEEGVIPVVIILWPPALQLVSRYPAHWMRTDTLLRRMVCRRRKKKGS